METSTLVVDVDAYDSIWNVQTQVETMTGIPHEVQQLLLNGQHVEGGRILSEEEIGSESTLSLILQGHGGMSDASDTDDFPQRRRRVAKSGVDAAFEDLGILRRCTHRIHRFGPGMTWETCRELLRDGDECASLGHWSLIKGHYVDSSTVSRTSLHAACCSGRADVIESLVCHYGIDVNGRDDCGWTALHTAMSQGDALACGRLVALGAEDVATDDGVHASSLRPELWRRVTGREAAIADSWPVPGSSPEALVELLRMLEEETESTEDLCRRVCVAVETLGTSVLEEMDTRVHTIRRWWGKWNVLTAAAGAGRYSLCRVCVVLGADADKLDEAIGETPLFVACERGQFEIARLLVDHGADTDKARDDGTTPLHIACQWGHLDCTRLLLNSGADVDKARDDGMSPLFIACFMSQLEYARLLADRGADVNHAMDDGSTPLHGTCDRNHRHVAAFLLERGADPTKRDTDGNTPAYHALSRRTPDPELADAMELATRDRTAAIERLWDMDAEGPRRR